MAKSVAKILPLLLLLATVAAQQQELSVSDYQRALQLRQLSVEFFDFFQNITLKDLMPSQAQMRIPSQQDLMCLAELNSVSNGLQSGSIWAMRMFDAWGSLPSGILYGNTMDLGNVDECIKINHAMGTNQQLMGKYCLAELPLISVITVKTAVCFPASCTAAHMDTLLKQLLQRLLNIEMSGQLVKDNNCMTAEVPPLDGLAIFTIVLLAILGTVMVVATLYDYFFCPNQDKMPALVKVFSARVNSRALFRIVDSKTNPNVIDCLHGIRCLSLMWVIFGHDYFFGIVSPNLNNVRLYGWLETPYAQLLIHGVLSVDTFFFLSGLLVCMVALRLIEKQKGKLNVPLMYLHRYLRITPMLAILILVCMKLKPYMADGPLINSITFDDFSVCERTWFWTLLYVQNYAAATQDLCISHSWYLGVDMQMYILSPIFLLALYKWGKKAAAGIFLLMLLLSACLFSEMVIKEYSMNTSNLVRQPDSMIKIYLATHTHASPWLVGFLFGYFLHVNRGKQFKLNRITVWLGWLLSLALILVSIFALYPFFRWDGPSLTPLGEAFYLTLTRIAWPLGLSWLVFACMHGYGSLANSFLSSPMWVPLSKLSFSAYIWHMIVEEINWGRTRTNTYFSDYDIMLRFWGDFGITVLVAYFMHILVEAPFGGLESLLLPSGKSKPPPKARAEVKLEAETEAPPPQITEMAPPLEEKSAYEDKVHITSNTN
ncbi:nose resistant to fluoxetine protein 6-like [Scaptodrosophila lebanonensis]|uniref:Nose resistant to fluoxetine protein 6-like n=1 Tax=Drosophila lebanonensis TaxID=7225 RepID=A0A6J2TSQ4_DROLE|nr:nose resistant to fluoxetine protein 6-like [Scaptodrosophila lebanonensis]